MKITTYNIVTCLNVQKYSIGNLNLVNPQNTETGNLSHDDIRKRHVDKTTCNCTERTQIRIIIFSTTIAYVLIEMIYDGLPTGCTNMVIREGGRGTI